MKMEEINNKSQGGFFKRLFSAFKRSNIESTDNKSSISNNEGKESTLQSEINNDKAELEKLIDEFKSQTSLNVDGDKLSNAINNYQYYESIQFYKSGYLDGLKGAKDKEVQSSALSRAHFILQHSKSILSGRISGLNTQIKEYITKKEEITDDPEILFNKEINDINRNEHRHFSLPMGITYVIFGIFLMFADLPISLSIAKYFIDLPINFEDSFSSKIQHPEILLFALGITFLSIYFKILYDDYINISLTKKIKKDNINPVTFMTVISVIVKLIILVALLYFLYNIGNMRNALNELSIEPLYPEITSLEEVFNYKLFSFIGSTILLPLLSGISLSVGLGIFSNRSNLKKSNSRAQELNKSLMDLNEEHKNNNMLNATLVEIQNDLDYDEDKSKNLAMLFESSYRQGYRKGHRTRFGYDLYANVNSLYIDSINS